MLTTSVPRECIGNFFQLNKMNWKKEIKEFQKSPRTLSGQRNGQSKQIQQNIKGNSLD